MPDMDDAALLAAEVRDRLPNEGYVHIARVLTEEVFTSAAKQLGTIELRTDIRVDSQADDAMRRGRDPLYADRPSVFRADGLSYHTDSPLIDILACIAWSRTPSMAPRRSSTPAISRNISTMMRRPRYRV